MSTTVTTTSWFSRIGSSIKGIFMGIILLIVATVLLFWNEGRAVKTYKSLKEGAGAVVSISADKIDPANNEMLVRLNGLATTDEIISDPEFKISEKALKLKRAVYTYQWIETKTTKENKKVGGSVETITEYSYKTDWALGLIDSSTFNDQAGHINPTAVLYQNKELLAKNVTLNDFKLTPSLLSKINNYAAYPLVVENISSIANSSIQNGLVYTGDTLSPIVGDLRIEYSIIKPTEVSIVSVQNGNTFKPFKAKAGRDIELLAIGNVSADEMFISAIEENKLNTWLLRGLGILCMFLGFSLILKPLVILGDVIPFIGTIIGYGTSFISIILTGISSSVTIGIAWIFYRPLLGIAILAIAGGLIFWVVSMIRKGNKEKKQEQDVSSKK